MLPSGYTVRSVQNDDIDVVLALLAACDLDFNGEVDTTADETLFSWRRPDTATWLVFDLEQNADAYGLAWNHAPGKNVIMEGWVSPSYRSQRLGLGSCPRTMRTRMRTQATRAVQRRRYPAASIKGR